MRTGAVPWAGARALWRGKWCAARLVLASLLLWAFVADTGSRLARMQLAALPGFDFLGTAAQLESEGRLGEALTVLDAGLDDESGADSVQRDAMAEQRRRVAEAQASWVRRAKDVGIGALTGQGTSMERLIGAVGADFFVLGDVRDLFIQGTKQLVDGDSDELILALSAAGVVTTLAPEFDWVPSLLKAARKAGSLPRKFGEHLLALLRSGRKAEVAGVMGDIASLGKRASPGGAVKLLRLADSPAEIGAMARFVERQPRGAFALGVTGRAGVERVVELGASADRAVVKAAVKGERGVAWLKSPAAKAAFRPHPLLGIAKGLWKGTIPALAVRIAEAMDARAWWIIPLLASWVMLESWWLWGAVRSGMGGVSRRDPA